MKNQILSFYNMAPLADAQTMHHMFARRDMTWSEFVTNLLDDLDWGVEGFLFHLPFGKDTQADHFMSFDSYLHAQERDLDFIWREFQGFVGKLTRGRYSNRKPIRVICYLGSLFHDPDFSPLLESQYHRDDWLRRVFLTLRPVLAAGCEVALDTAGTWPKGHPATDIATLLKDLKAGGILEGTEHIRRPDDVDWRTWDPEFSGHFRGFPITANHGHFWRNILPRKKHPSSRWDDPALYGEKILMIGGHSAPDGKDMTTYHEWMPEMVAQNNKAGYVSAIHVSRIKNQIPLEKLMICNEHR